jgi:hypothetical protein
MRDIREDLRERLSSLEAKRAEHHAALKELDEQAAAVMRMLDIEDREFPEQQPKGGPAPTPTKVLSDFIYEELGRRRMNKAEIKVAAERAGYENVGRAVHLTLVNMARFGRVRCGEDKKYERSAEERGAERSPLFSDMPRPH